MTVTEFQDTSTTLQCRDCRRHGLETEHNPNNNGLLIVCGGCGSKRPLGSLLYLRQEKNAKKVRRRDYPIDQGLYEVWSRYGNRCVVCTRTQGELLEMGVGISRHHVCETFEASGHDCPIVPVCNGCKTFVDARQRESLRWSQRLQELRAQSIPHGRTALSDARLSPDSLPAKGQDPDGRVERFSNDDAHH